MKTLSRVAPNARTLFSLLLFVCIHMYKWFYNGQRIYAYAVYVCLWICLSHYMVYICDNVNETTGRDTYHGHHVNDMVPTFFVCLRPDYVWYFYASAFRRRRHYVFGLSVRMSVRPSEAWNTLFWPVHGSVGPPEQPWPFYGMSVRPSVRRGFRAFAGEYMEGMVCNITCWCILTMFRTD